MIGLNIVECPDKDYLGEVKFYKDLIYIGKNLSADLYLPDKSLQTNHIFLEVTDGKLIAHSSKHVEYFWVNGKRTKNFKFLGMGDQIKIGTSTIKVVIFSPSTTIDKRTGLNNATDILINSKQSLLPLVQSLQGEE